MKHLICIWIFIIIQCPIHSQDYNPFSNSEIIVKLKNNETPNHIDPVMDLRFGLDRVDQENSRNKLNKITSLRKGIHASTYVLHFDQAVDVPSMVQVYKEMGIFEFVEPNYIGFGGGKKGMIETFPDDDFFSRQYGLYNDGSFSLSPAVEDADIDMELAWDIEQGSEDIIVAVLDSGVKLNHPEFEGRAWINIDESENGVDTDNNGYVDDVNGWNFADANNNPIDNVGHGTNVAGIIAANGDNNMGYAGVDWNCKIMDCKVLNGQNSGFYTWFAGGIYYAVDNGAQVINMSLGGSSYSLMMKDAVDYAYSQGVTIVVSMMNFNTSIPYYPAAYENTIAVGSTDANDHRTEPFFWSADSGSCYGSHIDLVAPGNYIYGLHNTSNTNYNTYWGGTSQSAPLVSGICALLLAQDDSRNLDELRSLINESAEDQVGDLNADTPGWDQFYGYGRLNAFAALSNGMNSSTNDFNDEGFNFYPNPSNGFVTIELPEHAKSIQVYSLEGRKIFTDTFQKNESEYLLKLDEQEYGIILVKILSNDETIIRTEKIVIH